MSDLERDSAYVHIQALFRRGLVTVIGSGASCGYGLPSMSALASHLVSTVPGGRSVSAESRAAWQPISEALQAGVGLEQAMQDASVPEELADIVTAEICSAVGDAEATAIREFLASNEVPAFGRLFQHVLRTNDIAEVVTTNYDRLLEVAAARAQVRVDTMFTGHTIGRLDEALSREELLEGRPSRTRPGVAELRTRKHVRLAKPHGSLDWYMLHGEHLRSELAIDGPRRVVAPGGNKYRLGYEIPFDLQRKRANAAIDKASAMLFIGYGFNDDHLQTYIRPKFSEVPNVVMAHTLTTSAREFLALNPVSMGIESAVDGGSTIIIGDATLTLPEPLWQVDVLLREILDV